MVRAMPAVLYILIAVASLYGPVMALAQDGKQNEPVTAQGGPLACLRLLVEDLSVPVNPPGLRSALRDLRAPSGKPTPMTESVFNVQVKELALFMLGQKGAEELKDNRFFKSKTGKIELEESLRGLLEEDSQLVRDAVVSGIEFHLDKIRYEGKAGKAIEKELAAEESVLILTHQLASLQSKTAEQLARYADLKGMRPIWLVGAESSDPLLATSVDSARLVKHSIGGDFAFKLPKLKTAIIAGGALDQCLMQTIHSVIMNTKGNVHITVIQPLTYIDMIGMPHATVPNFLVDHRDELRDYERRLRHEVEEMIGDDGYEVDSVTRPSPATLPSMSISNRRGRKIQLEFRQ